MRIIICISKIVKYLENEGSFSLFSTMRNFAPEQEFFSDFLIIKIVFGKVTYSVNLIFLYNAIIKNGVNFVE
jgi:hypothetical protein